MHWLILFVAGLFEIAWAMGLKYTHGFTKLTPTVVTIACILASLGLLGLAGEAAGSLMLRTPTRVGAGR